MDEEDNIEDLRADVTQLAIAINSYAQVLSAVVRALEKHNIEVVGLKLPTLN